MKKTSLLERLKGKHLHLSLDIDALDPQDAPATGTPVPNGLSLAEVTWLMQLLAEQKDWSLDGMDVVEVNPKICTPGYGNGQLTISSAIQLIMAALSNL